MERLIQCLGMNLLMYYFIVIGHRLSFAVKTFKEIRGLEKATLAISRQGH